MLGLLQISRQLLAALAGMHSRGIAHGSLGLQSLYINASKDEQGRRTWTAKLVEFPSAVHFTEGVARQDSKLHCGMGLDIVADMCTA